MMAIAGSWALSAAIQLLTTHQQGRRQVLRDLLFTTSILLLIYVPTLFVCFRTEYLSPANLAFGRSAMAVLRTEFQTPLNFATVRFFIMPGVGYFLPMSAAILFSAAIFGRNKILFDQPSQNIRVSVSLVLSALLALVLGIYLWFYVSEITQVRFFMPFAMMTVVYLFPLSLAVLDHCRKFAVMIGLFCCIQVINLCVLLVQSAPSALWQKWSGVSLSIGNSAPELAQAQEMLTVCRKKGESGKVYALDTSARFSPFLSVGEYNSLIRPQEPSLQVEFPLDWETATAIRIHDMVTSDYILFQPVNDPGIRKSMLATPLVKDFLEEKFMFEAALTDFTVQNGVQQVSETSVRLLKIVDRVKLLKALEALQSEHRWPAAFVNANVRECWTQPQIRSAVGAQAPALANIVFENTFKIDALQIVLHNGNTNLQLWWNPIGNVEGNWTFFIHEIDRSGNILSNRAFSLHGETQCSQDTPSHSMVIGFATSSNPLVAGIAIGFYRSTPAGLVVLQAKSGARDWENKRVLVMYEPSGSHEY